MAPPDVFAIGFQELVGLTASNIVSARYAATGRGTHLPYSTVHVIAEVMRSSPTFHTPWSHSQTSFPDPCSGDVIVITPFVTS